MTATSSAGSSGMESRRKVSHTSPGITQSECWSYMVVAFAFLVIFIGCGSIYSSPIMMVSFEKKLNATYSVMEKSWLGSTMISSMSMGSILAVPVMKVIGCRGSIIVGGFLAALGPALSVFATSLLFVCLTMGLLTGLGVGLTFIPALLSVELHFPNRGNRFATSIALSGIGIGVAAYPPGLNLTMMSVEWLYCLLIMSGSLFLMGVIGLLMKPPQGMASSKLNIEIFKEDSLSKPAFLSMCLVHFIWSFGSTIMYIYIPVYTLLNGHSSEEAAIMLSCIGGLSCFSRGMFRMVHLGEAVTMDTVTSIFCGLCLTAIFTGLFGDFSVKYTGLLSYSMLFGFYCGFWSNFINQVNRETIGQDVATAGSGFAMLATSFGSLAGPPLAGFLYGETKSHKNIFYVAGGCMMLCSLLLLGVKLLSIPSARLRKEIVKKISEKTHSKPKIRESVAKRTARRNASNTAGAQETGLLSSV